MYERSVRGGGAKLSKKIGRTSEASRFNIDKFSEVLRLRYMEKVISKRDDFVVDALFYFEPAHRFECMGDMFSFGVSVTARAREFCSNWRRAIYFCGKFR